MQQRALKYILCTTVLTLVMMIVVAGLVVSRVPAQWIPVDSVVTSTSIESRYDGGPPDWGLFVDIEYHIAGRAYAGKKLRVYTNDKWERVEREQRSWPVGKRFTTYVNPQNYTSVSLYQDGGRQGPAVAAALLTPALVILTMIFLYRKRRRGSDRGV
jgi:hypothetical protein